MRTTWRVQKIEATEGKTEARLVRHEWFAKNPAFEEMMERFNAIKEAEGVEAADAQSMEWPDLPEWLEDVQPGDEGAMSFDTGDAMTIDVTNSDEVYRPGDNVYVELTLAPASVDA